MKAILSILLCISIFLLGIQPPCRAVVVVDGCQASQCCKEEAGADDHQPAEKKSEEKGSCCVYNVLDKYDVPLFETYSRIVPSLNVSEAATNLLDAFLPGCWQPPRA